MNNLEPDYKEEYERLLDKVENFADNLIVVGCILVVAFCLIFIFRNL